MFHLKKEIQMENQELFDRYIFGELSPIEKTDFESRLKADKSFAQEFKTFLFVVKGIQNEEQQDCADFGAAMKKLSKEQLQEIIGTKAKPKAKRNILKFSPWLWSSLSAAAVVAIVVTISFNLINQSQLDMNNAQYMAYNIIAENNFIDGVSRGGSENLITDFSEVDEKDLKEKLPIYEKYYQQAQDDQDIEDYGLNLAMIYLKLHKKEKALDILKELQIKYPESINNYQKIISQIEKVENKR